MCNPGMAMMGTQAFGVGMSTVGSVFSASNEKAALRSQARMMEINAKIVDSTARNAIRVGTIEESRVKLATAQAKSQQRTQMASSGIDMAGSPTALARLTGTDVIGEVDANMVRSNALRAAWGQRFEAGNLRRQATSMNASADSISPFLAGFTSLVSGAGQVASSWYSLDKVGAFDGKAPAGDASLTGKKPGYTQMNWPQSKFDKRTDWTSY